MLGNNAFASLLVLSGAVLLAGSLVAKDAVVNAVPANDGGDESPWSNMFTLKRRFETVEPYDDEIARETLLKRYRHLERRASKKDRYTLREISKIRQFVFRTDVCCLQELSTAKIKLLEN
uniref:RxLR effector protein n=1 Tax=Macrostomum lignano TaxID=282301 RepID=A0A1I8J0S9_9PLAT